MDIQLTIVTMKNFTSVEASDTMSFTADLNMKFFVNEASGNSDLAVEMVLKDFYFDFHAVLNNM